MSYTLDRYDIFFIIWLVYVIFITGYWIGKYSQWKENEKEKKITTFEFEMPNSNTKDERSVATGAK